MIAHQYWVKDYGARAKSRHVLCGEAGDECYMQSIWHEILTYLMPDLPRAWYRNCQLTAQNIFVNIIFVMIM